MRTVTLKPGQFHGVCGQPWWVAAEDLTEAQQSQTLKHIKPKRDKAGGTWRHPVRCTFTTTDKKAWAEHLKGVHGKTYQARHFGDGDRAALAKSIRTPWKAPKLTEHGRAFNAHGSDLGARVQFEYRGAEHTGVVWSQGPKAKSVWVTPDEPIEDVRFLLLAPDRRGNWEVYEARRPQRLHRQCGKGE